MYPYAAKMLPEAYVERIPELEAPRMDKSDAAALEAGLAGLLGDARTATLLSLPPTLVDPERGWELNIRGLDDVNDSIQLRICTSSARSPNRNYRFPNRASLSFEVCAT